MTDLHDAFDQLDPGHPPRGAGSVLAAAQQRAGQARLRRRLAAGAGALTVLAIVAISVEADDSQSVDTDPGPVATDPTTTVPDPTTTETTERQDSVVSEQAGGNVDVFFSPAFTGDCSETVALPRSVPGQAVLRGALEELLAGPTPEERTAGIGSFFSAATADALRSVEIVDGTAHIDFSNFMADVPNASTSCGSANLNSQLDDTALQFSSVERTLYSFDGDVDAFYGSFEGVPPEHYTPSLPGWTESVDVNFDTGAVTAPGFNELVDAAQPAWAFRSESVVTVLLHLDDRSEGEVIELRQEPDGAGRVVMSAERSGLGDDSVAAVRYLIVLADAEDGSRRFESGSWTQRCQPGRGHQDFRIDPCV